MLEKRVINSYPYPIALTFKNLTDLPNSADSVELKHKMIGELFEAILRYLASIAIGQYIMDGKGNGNIDDLLSDVYLRSSTLDQWNIILKDILRFYRDKNKKLFMPEMDDFYFEKKRNDFVQLNKAYKELNLVLNDGSERNLRQISFNDFVPRLLKYHYTFWENKYSNLTKKQFKKRILLFEPAIEDILEELSFLADYKLIYVVSEDSLRKNNNYTIQNYMGCKPSLAMQNVRALKKLEEKRLYLCDFKKLAPRLSIYPFVVMEYCPPCSCGQIFFLRENNGESLCYISAQCGHEFSPSTYLSEVTPSILKKEKTAVSKDTGNKKLSSKPSGSTENKAVYKAALEMALLEGSLTSKKKDKLNIYRNKLNIDKSEALKMLKEVEAKIFDTPGEGSKEYLDGIIPDRISIPTSLIYKQYPHPLAYNFWKINQSTSDFKLTLKYVCKLLEATLTYLSSVLVTQYIRDRLDDININLVLERLVEPSLEEWLLFLEEVTNLYNEEGEKLIFGDFYKYYFSKQPAWDGALKAYNEISNDEFFFFKGEDDLDEISPAQFFKLIPDFVETIDYHCDDLSINQIKRLLAFFIPAVDDIMVSLKFLVAFKLFYVEKASYVKGKAKHEVLDCMGAVDFEHSDYLSQNYFAQDRVYLRSTVDKKFPVLNLSPFFVLTEYPEGAGRLLFFFQKVSGDGKLEYINYQNEDRLTSQEYTRDLIKAFRKFTSEKKINLVIKLLDWQKEKRKKKSGKRGRVHSRTSAAPVSYEERKLHEDAKKASEQKKQARNTYRYALETAWCDGILSEDERVYLDELQNVLKLASDDVKLIEVSTEAKFSVKVDRADEQNKKRDELEQHLEFLEEEHQMLLKSLEERRQQIRILGKSLKKLCDEKDICKASAEEAEKIKLEKEQENLKLKKILRELKITVDTLTKDSKKDNEAKLLAKKVKELEQAMKVRDKKLEQAGREFSRSSEELEEAKDKLFSLEGKVEELKSSLEVSEKEKSLLKGTLKVLEKEKEKEIEKFETSLNSLDEQRLETERYLKEKSGLEKKLIITNKKKDALLKLIQELKKNLGEASKAGKVLEQKNEELLALREDLQAGAEEKDSLLNLLSGLKEKIANLDLIIADNNKKLRLMDDLKSTVERLNGEKIELLNGNERQAKKIREVFGQLKEVRGEKKGLESKIEALGKAKARVEEKLEKFAKEFGTAKNFIRQAKPRLADYEKLKAERTKLLEQQKFLKESMADLSAKLVSSTEEVQRLEGELEETKSRAEGLSLLKGDLENQLLEAERDTLALSEINKKYNELAGVLDNFSQEREQLLSNNEKQKNKIIELIQAFAKSKEEHNNLIILKNGIEEENLGLITLNQELQERVAFLEKELLSFKEELSTLRSLKEKGEDSDKEKDFLFKSLESKTAKIKALEEKLGKIISVSEKLKEKYKILLQIKDKYEKELKSLQDKLSASQLKLESSEEKYKELEKSKEEVPSPSSDEGPFEPYMIEKLRIMKRKLVDIENREKVRLKEERSKKKMEVKRKSDDLRKQKEEWNKIKLEKEEIKKAREEIQAKSIMEGRGEEEGLKDRLIKEKTDLILLKDELERQKGDIELKKAGLLDEINKRQLEFEAKNKKFKEHRDKFERHKKAFEVEKNRAEKEKTAYKASFKATFEEKKKELLSLQKNLQEKKLRLDEQMAVMGSHSSGKENITQEDKKQ